MRLRLEITVSPGHGSGVSSPQSDFGHVALTSAEVFLDPFHGLSRDNKCQYGVDDDYEIPNKWHWRPITFALRREGEVFLLEANSQSERLHLWFSLRSPALGEYAINLPLVSTIEKGKTCSVAHIHTREKDRRFAPVMARQFRFVVVSLASAVPLKRVWIVGVDLPGGGNE